MCGRAMQVMVITGDNKLTAEAICQQIGVFEESEDLEGKSMTGRSFAELTPDKQRAVLGVSTYCTCCPGVCLFSGTTL